MTFSVTNIIILAVMTMYLTGVVAMAKEMPKAFREDGFGMDATDALLSALFIVGWPALIIAIKCNFLPGSKRP